MSSIRQRLLLSLFVVWATVWIAVAYVSLDRSGHEVGELMDAQLAQTAHVLRQITLAGHLPDVAGVPQTMSPVGHAYESMISFQLWRDGVLVSTFGAAPATPLAVGPGFSDQRIAETDWRVFGLPTGRAGETIYVAQSYAIRRELIEYLTLHALRPILWSMPLAALLIWLAVADGLRPLGRLAREIAHRSAAKLEPIDPRRAPLEIRPLAKALNALMARLDRALTTERHFAADASHELRTPFAAIRTHAQIAQRSTDPTERAEALRQLIRGIDRASRLISQLLALSRLQARAGSGEPSVCAVRDKVADVVTEMSAEAVRREIDLQLSGPQDDPCFAEIPPVSLGILTSNLIDNALKMTPPGGRIDVRILGRRERILLHIRDSGPGIRSQDRERVFDRFYRGAAADETGAGLGLSIVRRICELHGADIELLEAETGSGLLVEVRLRRAS